MRELATENVAVIMPAYNAELYIEQAILSVLNQTHTAWELWVVDDGSTDRTLECVEKFDDKRIHFYRAKHLGRPGLVRNLGSCLTNCPYLLFLDADDCLAPNALELALNRMASNVNYRMVYGFLTAIAPNGQPARSAGFKLIADNNSQTGFRLPRTYNHSPDKVALAQICISTTFLIESSFFKSLNGFDETFSSSEDMDLFFRAFLTDWKSIAALPMYMVNYRKNTASITRSPKNYKAILESQLRATQRFIEHPACPKEAKAKVAEAFMRRYSYVSGLCLEQGHRFLALQFCLQSFLHPATSLNAWLRHGLTLIPRAILLPNALDRYLKEKAAQWRDGAWQERFIGKASSPRHILLKEHSPIGTST